MRGRVRGWVRGWIWFFLFSPLPVCFYFLVKPHRPQATCLIQLILPHNNHHHHDYQVVIIEDPSLHLLAAPPSPELTGSHSSSSLSPIPPLDAGRQGGDDDGGMNGGLGGSRGGSGAPAAVKEFDVEVRGVCGGPAALVVCVCPSYHYTPSHQ